MTTNPAALSPRRFSAKHGVVLGLMLAGTLFTFGHPVYLAPPNFERTPLFYLLVWLAWLPTWFILRPAPTTVGARVIQGGFVLTLCFGCWGFAALPLPGFFTYIECTEPVAVGSGAVRYVCTRHALEERTIYTLEGYRGWPVVWVVEREFIP